MHPNEHPSFLFFSFSPWVGYAKEPMHYNCISSDSGGTKSPLMAYGLWLMAYGLWLMAYVAGATPLHYEAPYKNNKTDDAWDYVPCNTLDA
jgi:hypothetical protein